MSVLSSKRVAWSYTDDDGNVWRVAALSAWVSQGVLGGESAATTVPQRPGGYKMRRTTVSDGNGHSRTCPVYDPSATIITAGTELNFNANVAGVITMVTGTSNGGTLREGASKHNVTKQTS